MTPSLSTPRQTHGGRSIPRSTDKTATSSSSSSISRLNHIARHLSPNMAATTSFPADIVPQAPEDPLFGLARAYKADESPSKVDLRRERKALGIARRQEGMDDPTRTAPLHFHFTASPSASHCRISPQAPSSRSHVPALLLRELPATQETILMLGKRFRCGSASGAQAPSHLSPASV
ncbi:hypothetical protein FDECE_2513 [Fusarium decemcellulare]|nr:hypothetical protein FDECE_2513 [Fusarium decemcellulare]